MKTSLFQNQFISHSMHQLFNRAGAHEAPNDNEPPLRRYLRMAGRL
jgi:hypothetical protein